MWEGLEVLVQERYWEPQRGHELPWKVRGSLSRKACDLLAEDINKTRCGEEERAEATLVLRA